MTAYAVISAIGLDRVGIVEDISKKAVAFGCSIEESRMAVLGGEFAVIMLIAGEENEISDFTSSSAEFGEQIGLHIEARRTTRAKQKNPGLPYLIETTTMDTPGIVHAVTRIISSMGISIENLETDTSAAPWTGSPMFQMRARVVVPVGVSVAKLKEQLSDLEYERDMDISLKPVSAT